MSRTYSNERMKPLYLGLWFRCFFFLRHDRSPRTQPVLVACVWRETKARSFYARNLTSFALCYYVIGLFNKVQTNHKHKRKRMWFGCEQPFLWVEHCVTSQKTAAEETTFHLENSSIDISSVKLPSSDAILKIFAPRETMWPISFPIILYAHVKMADIVNKGYWTRSYKLQCSSSQKSRTFWLVMTVKKIISKVLIS